MEDRNKDTTEFWLKLYGEMCGHADDDELSQAVSDLMHAYGWLQHDILREAEEDELRRALLERAEALRVGWAHPDLR